MLIIQKVQIMKESFKPHPNLLYHVKNHSFITIKMTVQNLRIVQNILVLVSNIHKRYQ